MRERNWDMTHKERQQMERLSRDSEVSAPAPVGKDDD